MFFDIQNWNLWDILLDIIGHTLGIITTEDKTEGDDLELSWAWRSIESKYTA